MRQISVHFLDFRQAHLKLKGPEVHFEMKKKVVCTPLNRTQQKFLVGLKCIQVINPSSETKGTKALGPKTVLKSLLNLKKYFHFRPILVKVTKEFQRVINLETYFQFRPSPCSSMMLTSSEKTSIYH